MPTPQMTPEQRAAALEKARIVRQQRSEITNKLSMGIMSADEVLGKAKTEKLMEELGIPETRRIQGLGSKQMENLKKALA